MKFLHTADLHIGKIVNDFSMLEDQKFILEQISGIAAANQVDAVVIAGDVYDRAIPPSEAVLLLDRFLNTLTRLGIQVILVSGNHDSPERISFGENLFRRHGVHIAGVHKEELTKVVIEETTCMTEFLLLPFVKPAQVGAGTSSEAVQRILDRYWQEEKEEQKKAKKNHVLITHFFVTDSGKEPELSDSETTIHVGGLDNVDVSLFQGFDYVALGHIHKPQQIGGWPVWYSGSPLKYSFGEVKQTKEVLLVSMNAEGLAEVTALPLRPLREMRRIKGTLKELLEAAMNASLENPLEEKERRQDYIQAVLTDKGELIDPIGAIRSVYPNVMQIMREEAEENDLEEMSQPGRSVAVKGERDALLLFEAFYQEVRGEVLSEEGKKVVADIIKELEGKD